MLNYTKYLILYFLKCKNALNLSCYFFLLIAATLTILKMCAQMYKVKEYILRWCGSGNEDSYFRLSNKGQATLVLPKSQASAHAMGK